MEEGSRKLIHDKDIREPLFDFLDETYGKIRILEEKDAWFRVSTGFDTGWIKKKAVRIVPVHSDAKEE